MDRTVYIKWVDSCSTADHPWCLKESAEDIKPVKCESAGIVVNETQDFITIANSKTDEGQYAGIMCIPMCCVERVKELSEDE